MTGFRKEVVGLSLERLAALTFVAGAMYGCECGGTEDSKPPTEDIESISSVELDRLMSQHGEIATLTRDALIVGDTETAKGKATVLASLMENAAFPEQGADYARVAREAAAGLREAAHPAEVSLAFARLAQSCGQCHHELNRGPPSRLDPVPLGADVEMHMRRHFWAVERMWEALLTNSPPAFQAAAAVLNESPLHGSSAPDAASPPGVAALAQEVHDLAFVAASEGKVAEDEYVRAPGEPTEAKPTTRGQAEIFGRLLYTCHRCHRLVGVTPRLSDAEPPSSVKQGGGHP